MTESRETMRRRAFRDRAKGKREPAPAPWTPVVLRQLCVVELEDGPCKRPRKDGSQLCGPCDEETDRLAAERLAAGFEPAP